MRDARGRLAVLAVSALGLIGAGCGGGERQDADSPSGTFALEVTDASFPPLQSLAESSTLRFEVANRGERPVPDVVVTVETEPGRAGEAPTAFAQRSGDAGLADAGRPVWILDEGPGGGDSAYTNTWALGPLAAGASRTVEWRLTAVRAGRFTVGWRIAPALLGDVELADGNTAGEFEVIVDGRPVPARVGPRGEVVSGVAAFRD